MNGKGLPMMMKKLVGQIAVASVLLASANLATASDEWEFSLSPLFLWGMSINGDATIGDVTAPLNLEFKDDILENMEAVMTLHFEARKGLWTIFTEIQYVDLEPTVNIAKGPINVEADITFKDTMFELGGAYAFSESDSTRWEIIGGGRYTDQDIDIDTTISTPLPPPDDEIDIDEVGGDDWWHAFVGVRVTHSFNDKWTFIGRTDLGYGGSDNKAINADFLVDYRFRDWGSAFAGYRYLQYDYDNDSSSNHYAYDAKQQGPLLGLTIHW
jgi:hypothetical protein